MWRYITVDFNKKVFCPVDAFKRVGVTIETAFRCVPLFLKFKAFHRLYCCSNGFGYGIFRECSVFHSAEWAHSALAQPLTAGTVYCRHSALVKVCSIS